MDIKLFFMSYCAAPSARPRSGKLQAAVVVETPKRTQCPPGAPTRMLMSTSPKHKASHTDSMSSKTSASPNGASRKSHRRNDVPGLMAIRRGAARKVPLKGAEIAGSST